MIIFNSQYITKILKDYFPTQKQYEFIELVHGQTGLTDWNGYLHRIIKPQAMQDLHNRH